MIFVLGFDYKHDRTCVRKSAIKICKDTLRLSICFVNLPIILQKLQKRISYWLIRLMNFWGIALNGIFDNQKKTFAKWSRLCCIELKFEK